MGMIGYILRDTEKSNGNYYNAGVIVPMLSLSLNLEMLYEL